MLRGHSCEAAKPRTGGVILCRAADRTAVGALTAEGPCRMQDIADYEVIEFIPTRFLDGFDAFM